MVYAQKDKDGHVIALYQTRQADDNEELQSDAPEVLEFLIRNSQHEFNFLESDLQLVRVLEDLIDILMQKNIITITDFPPPAIEKLLKRQGFRNRLGGISGMEITDEML